MRTQLRAIPLLVLPFLLVLAAELPAQMSHDHGPSSQAADRLGTISFPTSAGAAAQADFIRGVLYMHSFEYDAARAAFREAQRKEPDFALAYWGEAMSYNHPIWNEQDSVAARAALARLAPSAEARAAKAGSARERAYLRSVEILYGPGGKAHRDTLYERAMARIAAAYADDHEAAAFHALAIMGLSQGVRNVDAYMRAGAIALRVFQRNGDHPGAAHYVIHAFDDPTHAPLGLDAAHAYSRIAPGAAHAQHMTTHIFLALGMWDGVIAQNEIASGPDRSRWQAGHYTSWLHYGLLQAGRSSEAVALWDTLYAHAGANAPAGRRGTLAWMRAHQVISGERWNDPALATSIPLAGVWPDYRAADAFARGYAAIRRGDLPAAAAVLAEAQAIPSSADAPVPGLMARQLEAALTRARGDRDRALQLLREVAAEAGALPVEFGPPVFVKPPYELLYEWLQADGRQDEARRAAAAAEAFAPGRLLMRRGR